jgi:alanine-synthesizing transaminase
MPTFSSRIPGDLTPAPLARALAARRAAQLPVLDLTISNPTRVGFTLDAAQLAAAFAHDEARYYEPHPRGLPPAREAVAAYYATRGIALPSGRIHCTASTSEAYAFLFMLLADAGDEILVPQPSYPLIEYLAGLQSLGLGRYNLRYDAAQGWRIDETSLEAARTSRTRAVVAVSPDNPTGSYLHPDDLALLERWCAEHDLALIVDEVFYDFPLRDDVRRTSAAARDTEALVFALSGVSKILALPQLKFGWIATRGPAPAVRRALDALDFIADTYLSVSTPVQLAVPALLARADAIQHPIITRCRENLATLADQFAGHAGAELLRADGGWYAVLRIDDDHARRLVAAEASHGAGGVATGVRVPTARRRGRDDSPADGVHALDESLALVLLERHGIHLHPGYFFDFRGGVHLVASLLSDAADLRAGTAGLAQLLRLS